MHAIEYILDSREIKLNSLGNPPNNLILIIKLKAKNSRFRRQNEGIILMTSFSQILIKLGTLNLQAWVIPLAILLYLKFLGSLLIHIFSHIIDIIEIFVKNMH